MTRLFKVIEKKIIFLLENVKEKTNLNDIALGKQYKYVYIYSAFSIEKKKNI